MKKTIVILMIQLIAVLGISAEAASIRRRDFAAFCSLLPLYDLEVYLALNRYQNE